MSSETSRWQVLLRTAAMPAATGWREHTRGRANYCDPSLPVASRIEGRLGPMAVLEKAAQLRCMWSTKTELFGDKLDFDPAGARA